MCQKYTKKYGCTLFESIAGVGRQSDHSNKTGVLTLKITVRRHYISKILAFELNCQDRKILGLLFQKIDELDERDELLILHKSLKKPFPRSADTANNSPMHIDENYAKTLACNLA